mmetsp:Transcript_41056/g.72207  ORF Transcript_41056/g.72207 Transcript_41056/m.72207 type:complete len:126 (-) Transcript_41056:2169-2546(-)
MLRHRLPILTCRTQERSAFLKFALTLTLKTWHPVGTADGGSFGAVQTIILASQLNIDDYPHPKMSTLVLRWRDDTSLDISGWSVGILIMLSNTLISPGLELINNLPISFMGIIFIILTSIMHGIS